MQPPKKLSVIGEIHADGERLVVIGDGPIADQAHAAKLIQLMTPLFKPSDPPGGLVCPLTWAVVVQLSTTFRNAWWAGPKLRDWITREMTARASKVDMLSYLLPVNLVPRTYQTEGALMIGATGRMVIFDEPGTGKTVTAILGLRERVARGHVALPILVVAPNSVVDSWVKHFREWAPSWSSIAWRGSPDFRKRLVGTHDVYVVSYETARNDAKNANPRQSPLVALGANTVVCDEQHMIKNNTTDRSKAVVRLAERAQNFVGLSGTPITHSPKDLWPALKAMSPGAWPSGERWIDRFCLSIPGDYGAAKVIGLNKYTEAEFWNCLMGQHRRVAKADVLAELPPKQYSVRTVELPPAYRKAYDQMAEDMLAELPDTGEEISVMGILAQLTRLSQMACAAADVEVTRETKPDEYGNPVERVHQKVWLKDPSWKIDAAVDVLAERCGPNGGEQVVVFAPSRQLIKLAGARFVKEGYKVGFIMGGQSAKERTQNVDSFQAGQLDVICVVTQAGGVGITLHAAGTAVFLARPWSLVDALQAEDRLHRIGADHEFIQIIDIVAANTIDSRVRAVLKERAGALSDLVKDPRVVAELLGGASVTKLKVKVAS